MNQELGLERLEKLGKHLLTGKLGHTVWNFNNWSAGERKENGCGTNGCALGECLVVFPKDWVAIKQGKGFFAPILKEYGIASDDPTGQSRIINSAMEYFGVSEREATHLFLPGCQLGEEDALEGDATRGDATRQEVGQAILRFVAKKRKLAQVEIQGVVKKEREKIVLTKGDKA